MIYLPHIFVIYEIHFNEIPILWRLRRWMADSYIEIRS